MQPQHTLNSTDEQGEQQCYDNNCVLQPTVAAHLDNISTCKHSYRKTHNVRARRTTVKKRPIQKKWTIHKLPKKRQNKLYIILSRFLPLVLPLFPSSCLPCLFSNPIRQRHKSPRWQRKHSKFQVRWREGERKKKIDCWTLAEVIYEAEIHAGTYVDTSCLPFDLCSTCPHKHTLIPRFSQMKCRAGHEVYTARRQLFILKFFVLLQYIKNTNVYFKHIQLRTLCVPKLQHFIGYKIWDIVLYTHIYNVTEY